MKAKKGSTLAAAFLMGGAIGMFSLSSVIGRQAATVPRVQDPPASPSPTASPSPSLSPTPSPSPLLTPTLFPSPTPLPTPELKPNSGMI